MMHLHIIKRSDAKVAGLDRYCTGKPCKYNQYGERLTSNGMCRCWICRAVSMAKSLLWARENREQYKKRQRDNRTEQRKAERIAPHNPTFISREQIR